MSNNLNLDARRKNNIKYGLMIIVVAAFWGAGNPALKIAVEAMTPLYTLVIRFFLAGLIFLILKFSHIKKHIKKSDFKNMFFVAIFIAGAYIAAAYAMLFTSSTNAGFFMSMGAIFTPFVAYFALKHKLNKNSFIPVVIVAAGIYFLSTSSGNIVVNPGDIIAIMCALFGAGMFVVTGKYASDTDPIVASTMQLLFVSLICFAFALFVEPFPDLLHLGTAVWGSILFMVVFCTCLAYFIQNLALKHVSPTYVAIIFASEPIFGAIASYFMLGEMLTLRGFLGAALIMISIVWASLTGE